MKRLIYHLSYVGAACLVSAGLTLVTEIPFVSGVAVGAILLLPAYQKIGDKLDCSRI
jgi:hypothetical protein